MLFGLTALWFAEIDPALEFMAMLDYQVGLHDFDSERYSAAYSRFNSASKSRIFGAKCNVLSAASILRFNCPTGIEDQAARHLERAIALDPTLTESRQVQLMWRHINSFRKAHERTLSKSK